MSKAVRIYVVTYRRPVLLRRALRSLQQQTHADWTAEVLNDDPADTRVSAALADIGDPRITLAQPAQHRGGTRNFNHAFRRVAEPFATILEDDNWWEPTFLSTMLGALERYPAAALACGNERLWREQADGSWLDTGRTIWPDSAELTLLPFRAVDKCGSAKLCNSSMVFRTAGANDWRTPDTIPIDVTEHFRERVVPHPLLLVPHPLVNYGETLRTHRSQTPGVWGGYQLLLIGSVFTLLPPERRLPLARELWSRARNAEPQLATSLLATGRFVPAARVLWQSGTVTEKARFLRSAVRHPVATLRVARARQRHAAEWKWLLARPLPAVSAEPDHNDN